MAHVIVGLALLVRPLPNLGGDTECHVHNVADLERVKPRRLVGLALVEGHARRFLVLELRLLL